jgi:hypothetical protein
MRIQSRTVNVAEFNDYLRQYKMLNLLEVATTQPTTQNNLKQLKTTSNMIS